jgi:hypothetical protein
MKFFFSTLIFFFSVGINSCKKNHPTNVHLSQGLLAYYPFNGNANDESGNGNNGTLFNNATIVGDKNGKPLSALSLTGANGVIVNSGNKLVNADEMTITMDVMQRQTGTRQCFISSVNYNTGFSFQYWIGPELPSDPKTYFAVARYGAICDNFYNEAVGNLNGIVLEKESWYTIVATFKNGAMKMYVNGALTGEGTAPATTINVCTNSNFLIGSWWKNDPIGLNGKIDNVRVYNRELNSDEIKALSSN